MKVFSLFLFAFCLLSAPSMAQEDSPLDFLNTPDSVKIKKRFIVKEPASLLGFNSYISEGNGLDMPDEISFMDQRIGRSIQWGIGLVDFRLGLNGKDKVQKLGLQAGLRWNLSFYSFQNDFQLVEGADSFEAARIDVDKEVKKHRLLASYIAIPLMIDFNSNPAKSLKTFRFSVGYVQSFLLNGRYKLKYEDKEKVKVKDNFNLNENLGKLEARIGYGPGVIYFQYGLDGLFTEGKGPNVIPVSIGFVSGGL